MLNEFVLKFKCNRCGHLFNRVFNCQGSLDVMKLSLKKPKCKCGEKREHMIQGFVPIENAGELK